MHFSFLPIPAKFLDELLGARRDVAREIYGVDSLEDDVVGLHGVGAGEGRRAGEQLEHEDTEGPVVGGDVVPLVEDHLRGHVLGRAAEGPRLPPNLDRECHVCRANSTHDIVEKG
jgi:hypothetical protein